MSAVFDLNGLKERIRSVLATANTTTATYPLSASMDSNVSQITKLNPDRVFHQHSRNPSVHIYTEGKDISLDTIAVNQINAKRKGTVKMNILGIVSDFNIEDKKEDKAQKNVEFLMENIELVLRDKSDLNNFSGVRYIIPTDVNYASFAYEEDAYFRAGLLSLDVHIFY